MEVPQAGIAAVLSFPKAPFAQWRSAGLLRYIYLATVRGRGRGRGLGIPVQTPGVHMEPYAKPFPASRRRLPAMLRGAVLLVLLPLAASLLAAAPSTSPLPAFPGAESPAKDEVAPAAPEATIRFYNRDIVTLRTEFLGRTPELRARTSEMAIRRVVEQSGPLKVNFKQSSEGLLVLLSDELVMILTAGDLDVLHGETMDQARIAIAGRLQEAVDTARREQAPARLAQRVGRESLQIQPHSGYRFEKQRSSCS